MAPKSVLLDIRKDLESYVGEKIRLRDNKGRKKIVEREGVLEGTYPNHFLVKLEEESRERRVSYSYADLLTESVEVVIMSSGGLETKIDSHPR